MATHVHSALPGQALAYENAFVDSQPRYRVSVLGRQGLRSVSM